MVQRYEKKLKKCILACFFCLVWKKNSIFAKPKRIEVMKRKRISILTVLMTLSLLMSVAWAQTPVSKETRKQAKTFKKEGWTVADGEKDMELQLADLQRYTNDILYIVESATQKSKTYHLGYTSARAKALRGIASRLSTLIASDTEVSQVNLQSSDGEVESQVALNSKIRSISQETLSDAFPVLVMSRQLPDGTCEVQVHLAIAVPEK